MNRITKSLAIASLAAAVLAPFATDAQAWWGHPWGPYGAYPYYGGYPYWGGYPYYGGGPWGYGPWRRWWW